MKAFSIRLVAALAPFVLAADPSANSTSCADDSVCGSDQCIHQPSSTGLCQTVPTASTGNCINNSTCVDGLICVYNWTPVTMPAMLGNCWKPVYALMDGECGDPFRGAYDRIQCGSDLKCIRSNPRDGGNALWKGVCKATNEGLAKVGEACDNVSQIDGYHCGKGMTCDAGKCSGASDSRSTASVVYSTAAGLNDKKSSGSVLAAAGFFGLAAALWMY
ncbi:hypothetical protein BJ741DRAFT_615160 [Chytriomyces cf. hyalinus JEL632]|nr:hypothetical protein BJ741DRAFT_615160 [Chytriomyces cf. hyalinus JEL632]